MIPIRICMTILRVTKYETQCSKHLLSHWVFSVRQISYPILQMRKLKYTEQNWVVFPTVTEPVFVGVINHTQILYFPKPEFLTTVLSAESDIPILWHFLELSWTVFTLSHVQGICATKQYYYVVYIKRNRGLLLMGWKGERLSWESKEMTTNLFLLLYTLVKILKRLWISLLFWMF
jgi:hypothetical protein